MLSIICGLTWKRERLVWEKRIGFSEKKDKN